MPHEELRQLEREKFLPLLPIARGRRLADLSREKSQDSVPSARGLHLLTGCGLPGAELPGPSLPDLAA